MFSLFLVVMSIMLVGALALVSIKYIPFGFKERDQIVDQLSAALPKLENAYDVVTRANSGTPPTTTAAADGGFADNFLPVLRFTPALPPTMSISYGLYSGADPKYTGLNYFCIKGSAEYLSNDFALKGIAKTKNVFSPDQYFISETCGVPSNINVASPPANYVITFFVAYVPPVSP